MDDLTYIKSNFLEQKELCKITNISLEKLNELIQKKLVPNFSYKVEVKNSITSPLGDKKESIEIKKYFPKSAINYVENSMNKSGKEFKNEIKKEYIQALVDSDLEKITYQDEKEFDAIFEVTWKHFLDGVYGICTLNSTPKEIAKKGIIVQKLINFIKNNKKLSLESKQENLVVLNDEYNEVSNIFAPYQRKNSSRGKYLDSQLKILNLENLIKKYS